MQGLFERGVAEFNDRSFFEAHDTWEELWRETTGPHRLFYQGLIQTAVGFYHLSNGNFRGACSQFGKALIKLGEYVPQYEGIETLLLVEEIKDCLSEAELLRDGRGAQWNIAGIPTIQRCKK